MGLLSLSMAREATRTCGRTLATTPSRALPPFHPTFGWREVDMQFAQENMGGSCHERGALRMGCTNGCFLILENTF